MLNQLGRRRFAVPLVALIAIFLVLGTAFYPNLHVNPKDVPFAIVNLDEGTPTPAGAINLGETIAAQLQVGGAPGAPASPIVWTELDSQAALDAALEDNQFYGAIVIPADFTTSQFAAEAGEGTPAVVQVMINPGKNALLATTMQTGLTAMLVQTGLSIDVTVIHGADVGGGSMGALMSGMILVMPTMMMTILCSVLLFLLLRPAKGASRVTRLKAYGLQVGTAVALSAAIAALAVLLTVWGGLNLPTGAAFLFLWLASFFLAVLFIGALDLLAPLGILVIASCFALGMSSAMFAKEMLPAFWQTWVYPWVPQRFMGDGIRSIIYLDASAWNSSVPPLAITGAIGLVLFALAALLPARSKKPALVSAEDPSRPDDD